MNGRRILLSSVLVAAAAPTAFASPATTAATAAAPSAVKAAPAVKAAAAVEAPAGHRRFGVMLDVGLPDGANASLVFRPLRYLDVHAGGGHNMISPGVRAGVAAHLPTFVSPAIAAEAGHYFTADANKAVARLGLGDSDDPLLREVGYDYANLHVGVEIGRERVQFYLHAGWSVVRGKLRNVDEAVAESADAEDGFTVEVREDPTITLVTPSAKLGLAVFF
jgi:hypothetical protein